MTMHTHRRQRAGFTIIELIVAIALAAMLAFLVNSLFFETSRAVQMGTRTGDMLVESESIGDQLRRDARRMNGPNGDGGTFGDSPPGVLVIVNRLFWWDEGNEVRVVFDGEERRQSVRSDQLAFITRRTEDDEGEFRPLTPQNDGQFHNENEAEYARVWYGHVLRTDENGETPPDPFLPNTSPANNWALGRQQLLLTGDNPPAGTHAEYFTFDASVVEDASGSSQSQLPPVLFQGITDVSNRALFGDASALIEQLQNPENTSDTYGSLAADLAFIRSADQRLHVNPTPSPAAGVMESWQLAQMHGILAMGVSDFIVEFAGDYESPDDEIDRDAEGYIKWYGFYYNNPHDPDQRNFPIDSSENPDDGPFPYDAAFPRSYDVRTIAGSFPDLDGENAEAPHYDDIEGNLVEENAHAVLVFRHDDDDPDNSNWPHLIRIRYRLHDHRGMVTSTMVGYEAGDPYDYPTSGRWFEHVIRVPRP